MTYAQAAKLTWPQMLHALGIEAGGAGDDAMAILNRAQDQVFDAVIARRGYFPIDLMRLPVADLIELTKNEGKPPAVIPLLAALRRYLQTRPPA